MAHPHPLLCVIGGWEERPVKVAVSVGDGTAETMAGKGVAAGRMGTRSDVIKWDVLPLFGGHRVELCPRSSCRTASPAG